MGSLFFWLVSFPTKSIDAPNSTTIFVRSSKNPLLTVLLYLCHGKIDRQDSSLHVHVAISLSQLLLKLEILDLERKFLTAFSDYFSKSKRPLDLSITDNFLLPSAITSPDLFLSSVSSKATLSSKRGIVAPLSGGTRVFAHKKFELHFPHSSTECTYTPAIWFLQSIIITKYLHCRGRTWYRLPRT